MLTRCSWPWIIIGICVSSSFTPVSACWSVRRRLRCSASIHVSFNRSLNSLYLMSKSCEVALRIGWGFSMLRFVVGLIITGRILIPLIVVTIPFVSRTGSPRIALIASAFSKPSRRPSMSAYAMTCELSCQVGVSFPVFQSITMAFCFLESSRIRSGVPRI